MKYIFSLPAFIKLSIVLIFSHLMLISVELKAQKSENTLQISHLTGDFYIYTTYRNLDGTVFPSNSMYILTDKGVVMIDTPWDSLQFQPLLDSIEKRHHQKVIFCISTHSHSDRTAGLSFLREKGIATWSSQHTLQLCRQNNENLAEHTFTKDTTFSFGRHTFTTFFPGAGHAPDNIVIWFPQQKILYGGCFVKSTENLSLGNIADANPAAWKKSIQTVIKKYPDVAYVIPGHYGWQDKKALQHTLKLLEKY